MKKYDLSTIKTPFTITLVGIPLVGKSTFIESLFGADFTIISSDDITMEMYPGDYGTAYTIADPRIVDKEVSRRTIDAAKNRKNVVFDLMNIRKNRRRRNLGQFPKKYTNIAFIFPVPTDDILNERNKLRQKTYNKNIPYKLLIDLAISYQVVTEEEGFDIIIYL